MKVDVLNMQGEKVESTDLPAAIFEAPVKVDLMHQAFERQMANARAGTHSTKGRSEVRGGGRKPWRQKGTGRARHGSIRSPLWVGGGAVHAPKPRDHSKDMPKKMRRAALRSALSAKAAESEIVVLDEFKVEDGKTRTMAEVLDGLVGEESVVILLSEPDEKIELAARNLPQAITLRTEYLNIRDLLGHRRVILPLDSLDAITQHLAD